MVNRIGEEQRVLMLNRAFEPLINLELIEENKSELIKTIKQIQKEYREKGYFSSLSPSSSSSNRVLNPLFFVVSSMYSSVPSYSFSYRIHYASNPISAFSLSSLLFPPQSNRSPLSAQQIIRSCFDQFSEWIRSSSSPSSSSSSASPLSPLSIHIHMGVGDALEYSAALEMKKKGNTNTLHFPNNTILPIRFYPSLITSNPPIFAIIWVFFLCYCE